MNRLLLLVLLGATASAQDEPATNISERQLCYVPGQCQEYSVNFKKTIDVDSCHKFCGKNEDCEWWSYEPAQNLCILFANCTESGPPEQAPCSDCISGQKLCPARDCHEAVKCEGHFIDSFKIAHLEDCIKACSDDGDCQWYTLEKTNDHCLLYEECKKKMESCDTCATGPRECSVGYHGPTPAPGESGTASGKAKSSCLRLGDKSCKTSGNKCCSGKCQEVVWGKSIKNSLGATSYKDMNEGFMCTRDTCADDKATCKTNTDCCSGNCYDLGDNTPPKCLGCSVTGEAAYNDYECCSGKSDKMSNCDCGEKNTPCLDDTHCCNGFKCYAGFGKLLWNAKDQVKWGLCL